MPAGLAGASESFHLTVSPSHLSPGGKVTIYTTPRLRCRITLSVAGRRFSHEMRYGWIQITMPRGDVPGRVPVRVGCDGRVVKSAFTVHRHKK